MVGDPATFGILTVSDRASKGEYQDEGGPAILGFFEEAISSEWSHHYRVVPDEIEAISNVLIEMVDQLGCSVIVTTGGTGPSERDVTPEATIEIGDKVIFLYKGKKLWEGSNKNITDSNVKELNDFVFANRMMREFK